MATELHTQRRHRLLPILIMLAVLATSSPIAVGNPQAVRAQAEPCVVGDDNFDAGIDDTEYVALIDPNLDPDFIPNHREDDGAHYLG